MQRKVYLFLSLLIFIPFLRSSAQGFGSNETTVDEYIAMFKDIARSEMTRTGIPASITLAQGILESRYGNSELATKANNHFGIKCHTGWTGKTMHQDDDAKNECFRKYNNPEESYYDHSDFLTTRDRYAFLFDLEPTDYKGWAHGLKKAGYATNPQYAYLLIKIIEERNLHIYDMDEPDYFVSTVLDHDEDMIPFDLQAGIYLYRNIKTVIVQPGESPISIARKHGLPLKNLVKYNDLQPNATLMPGSRIYLQPKKRKGLSNYHIVQEGETMHSISQMEGMRLSKLYKKNLMAPGEEPKVGQKIFLKKKRKSVPLLKTKEEIEKTKKFQEDVTDEIEELPKKEIPKEEPKPEQKIESKEDPKPEEKTELKDETPVVQPDDSWDPVPELEEDEPEIPLEIEQDHSTPEPDIIPDTEVKPVEPDAEEVFPDAIIAGALYHTVTEKETLYGISKEYGVSVEELRKLNEMEGYEINIGQQLLISMPEPQVEEEVEEMVTEPELIKEYYWVEPKMTLYSIAKKFDVSVEDIKSWNDLEDNELKIGQQLIIMRPRQ